MADIQHMYGNDLTVSTTGDLAVSDGTQFGIERVIRRLMTSQGQYIWQLNYGAGLPMYLGNPAYPKLIEGAIREQMRLEDAVSQNPPPAVNVPPLYNDVVTASIQYVDADTGESAVLTLPISGT
jgi:hypothetical protein